MDYAPRHATIAAQPVTLGRQTQLRLPAAFPHFPLIMPQELPKGTTCFKPAWDLYITV